MKLLQAFASIVALSLVIVPACLYLGDAIDKSDMKTLMLGGTILWFISAPFWLGNRKS